MFVTEKERRGTYYFEFQYCTYDNPVKNGKTDWRVIEHWSEDSLLMNADDFDVFYPKYYKNVFDCALFPNGYTGFDYCGVNYYDSEKTERILKQLETVIENEYYDIIPWLKEAVKRKKGFYILGL